MAVFFRCQFAQVMLKAEATQEQEGQPTFLQTTAYSGL